MKRLFIVGCPRSGTTWTMLLLAQHPEIASCQQTSLFLYLETMRNWWRRNDKEGKSLVRIADANPDLDADTDTRDEAAKNSDGPAIRFDGLISKTDFNTACRNYLGEIYRSVGDTNADARVILDQTPDHVRAAEFIGEIFPDAYFLHVVRDPRGAVSSLQNASRSWAGRLMFPANVCDAAKYWKIHVDAGHKIAAMTDRYREVRYEAMLENGPERLAGILDWLELPHDRSYCEKAVAAVTIDKMSRYDEKRGFFRKGKAKGWRNELSNGEIAIVEYLAGDLMERLEYERVGKSRPGKPLRLSIREIFQSCTGFIRRASNWALRPWQTESYWDIH